MAYVDRLVERETERQNRDIGQQSVQFKVENGELGINDGNDGIINLYFGRPFLEVNIRGMKVKISGMPTWLACSNHMLRR